MQLPLTLFSLFIALCLQVTLLLYFSELFRKAIFLGYFSDLQFRIFFLSVYAFLTFSHPDSAEILLHRHFLAYFSKGIFRVNVSRDGQ